MRTYARKLNQPLRKSSTQLTRSNRLARAAGHEAHPLLNLQRTIGNQALLRLLQARADGLAAAYHTEIGPTTEGRSENPTTNSFAHDFSRVPVHGPTPITIQPKLAVNTPGDSYEQEADQIADQVMRMPEPQLQRACACGGGCAKCQTDQLSRDHRHLQTRNVESSDAGPVAAPPIVHEVLASPGQPLDASTREFFEPRFEHDFSRVRLHSGPVAERSAREVNADAYTVGHHIVLGPGRFTPETDEGRRLLSHELTHVVQQGSPPRVAIASSGNISPSPTFESGTGAEITPTAPGIQRRNGGGARPMRPPPLPSRGRSGQREGQRLPRNIPSRSEAARREAFEQRERARADAARQRWDATIARNQKWLENWGKHGSEPKTPGQRAFYVLVKMLEAWDEVSSSWDKTHSDLESLVWKRLDHLVAKGRRSLFDRQLIAAWTQLNDFDVEMLRRLTEWQERMDKWEQWRDRVYMTPTNVINLSLDLAVLLIDAHRISVELREQLNPIDRDIQALSMELFMRPWLYI